MFSYLILPSKPNTLVLPKLYTIVENKHLKEDCFHQVASNVPTRMGSADTATYQQIYSQPSVRAQAQAKEADIQALAQLTRALDKKV